MLAILASIPLLASLIFSAVVFLSVEETEFKKFEVWIPEHGREGDILDISGSVNLQGSFRNIDEISLAEFQDRNYRNVVYGWWAFDTDEMFVFYWVNDPNYPMGVWARTMLSNGFGRSRDLLFPRPEECSRFDAKLSQQCERAWAENTIQNPTWPFALFDNTGVWLFLETNWDNGETFIPTVGPKWLIIFSVTLGLILSLLSLDAILRKKEKQKKAEQQPETDTKTTIKPSTD